jgi:hypothetical protein
MTCFVLQVAGSGNENDKVMVDLRIQEVWSLGMAIHEE